MSEVMALKTPPHNMEIEMAVIGALLTVPNTIDLIIDIASVDDFYSSLHQVIYKTCLSLHQSHKVVDTITVVDYLSSSNQLDAAGGVEYISDLATNNRGSANVTYYAYQIHNKALERRLIMVANKIADVAYSEIPTDDKIQNAQSEIMAIGQKNTKSDLTGVNIISRNLVEEIDRRCQLGTDLVGLSSGFKDIDNKTYGYEPGNLIVLAGRPSMGKTTVAMNTVERAAIDGKFVLVFSLEMPKESLLMRCYSSIGNIHFAKLRKGRLNDEDWPNFNQVVGKLKDLDLYIDDTSMITTSQIRTRSRRLQRKVGKPIDLIMVDYIQIMGDRHNGNENNRISYITQNLKSISKEFDCPVMAISQLNRSVDDRKNKRPYMSDLKDSGAIEQDADIIIFMYRDEYYNPQSDKRGVAEAIIGKQRNGETGTVYLKSELEFMRFVDFDGEIPKDDYVTGSDSFDFLDSQVKA